MVGVEAVCPRYRRSGGHEAAPMAAATESAAIKRVYAAVPGIRLRSRKHRGAAVAVDGRIR